MYCDSCDLWIHVFCDLYFTEVENDYLVQSPSSDPWFFSTCTDHLSDSLQSHSESSEGCKLQCLFFNGCSIYCKHFNLAAYIDSKKMDDSWART